MPANRAREMRGFAVVLATLIMMGNTEAAESVQLYAAGSLRGALTDVAKAFEASIGNTVQAKFGASGLLMDEIVAGAKTDVFASANMEHPQALAAAEKSGPVVLFARNQLFALVRPGLKVTPATLLDSMLDAKIKLGTSTPKADPSGDYAFEVFRRAETVKRGAQAALEGKVLLLTGSPSSASAPAGRSVYGWNVAEGRADIFLTYCTGAVVALKENPGQQMISLPDALAVGADYGLTVMADASSAARQFAQFILSPQGQNILASCGFAAAAGSK